MFSKLWAQKHVLLLYQMLVIAGLPLCDNIEFWSHKQFTLWMSASFWEHSQYNIDLYVGLQDFINHFTHMLVILESFFL
jgi:hypothetical protein